MMKRSFRDAWTAKLRSGEFIQFRKRLACETDTTKRCCLGVAYAVEGVLPERNRVDGSFFAMPLSCTFQHKWGLSTEVVNDLARRNDGIKRNSQSFLEIADYIDTLPVEEG